MILGVEVDSLGNWHKAEEIEELSGGNLEVARGLIRREVDWLYDMGVRQVTPIHLANNAFGGTAIYMRFLETVNMFLTGEHWDVEDAWTTGVRYRVDDDGDDLFDEVERAVVQSGGRNKKMTRRTLLDYIPGISNLRQAQQAPRLNWRARQCPRVEQIRRDPVGRNDEAGHDHRYRPHVRKSHRYSALTMAEEHKYPVMASHCWFRDLLYSAEEEFDHIKHEAYGTSDIHKVAHEAGKRGDQVQRIGRLGGIVAPILNQGDIAGLRRCMPELTSKVPEPNAGSSTSWAQAYLYAVAKMGGRGVAMGSDINGAAGLPVSALWTVCRLRCAGR